MDLATTDPPGLGSGGGTLPRQISRFGAGASDTKVRECYQHVWRVDGLMCLS